MALFDLFNGPNTNTPVQPDQPDFNPGILQSIFMASRPGQRYYQVKNDLKKQSALEALVNQLGDGKFADPKSNMSALMRYASVSGEGIPSGLKEYIATRNLPDQDMQRYLGIKRQLQLSDLGGSVNVLNALNPQQPITSFEKTGTPAAQGTITDVQKKEQGQNNISEIADDLLSSYQDLDAIGGIVNTKKSALENIKARAGSSAIGQFVGGAVGKQEQTVRDDIQAKIPLLMSAIKSATGKSASEVNSIPEMQLLKKSVSDPTQSLQTVQKTLSDLVDLYGAGESTPRTVKKKDAGQTVDQVLKSAQPRSEPPALSGGLDRNAALEELRRRGLSK